MLTLTVWPATTRSGAIALTLPTISAETLTSRAELFDSEPVKVNSTCWPSLISTLALPAASGAPDSVSTPMLTLRSS